MAAKVICYFFFFFTSNKFKSQLINFNKRQCVCVFTSDDLIEKFHHFLHNIITTSIYIIKTLPNDVEQNDKTTNTTNTTSPSIINSDCLSVKQWQIEYKEKLLIALVKIFSLNMPLYVTYKHLLFNHGRYNTIKECSCSKLSNESIALVYLYCQTNSSTTSTTTTNPTPNNSINNSTIRNNNDETNLPIELLRNIAHFIDLNGLAAIRICFTNSMFDTLPLQIAHILFNVIVNVSKTNFF